MTEPEKLSREQFERFRDFIYRHSGIRVEVSKITLVTNRVRRRLRALGLHDFDAYYRLLTAADGEGELTCFLDAVTTNETSFFRTPQHFTWFQEEFLPAAGAAPRGGSSAAPLRVWSAACSTGPEPYSLAICVRDSARQLAGRAVEILGTDLSAEALRVAREGVYRARDLEELPAARRSRYFQASADGSAYSVGPALRELVRFRRHNLMTPLRAPLFDCVFIRNVLIYFDRASKERVVEHLIRALAPGGFLVVGPSEGIYDLLGPLVKQQTFLYQKPH